MAEMSVVKELTSAFPVDEFGWLSRALLLAICEDARPVRAWFAACKDPLVAASDANAVGISIVPMANQAAAAVAICRFKCTPPGWVWICQNGVDFMQGYRED